MSTTTTRFKLLKPDLADNVDVSKINANANSIDGLVDPTATTGIPSGVYSDGQLVWSRSHKALYRYSATEGIFVPHAGNSQNAPAKGFSLNIAGLTPGWTASGQTSNLGYVALSANANQIGSAMVVSFSSTLEFKSMGGTFTNTPVVQALIRFHIETGVSVPSYSSGSIFFTTDFLFSGRSGTVASDFMSAFAETEIQISSTAQTVFAVSAQCQNLDIPDTGTGPTVGFTNSGGCTTNFMGRNLGTRSGSI